MADVEKIEKIKKISKSTKASQQVQQPEELQRVSPNKERFDNLMQVEKPQLQVVEKKVDPSSTKRNSLFDEVTAMSSKSQPRVTPTELIAQTEKAINKMEDIKTKLQTPGLELKDSAQPLLQNKLTHIDDNIRIALNKSGLEHTEAVKPTTLEPPPTQNPIMRFLGFMTDGQYQLKRLALQVENWHLNGVDINPAAMLSVQIKVNYITQELEFFSSLLNKALESTKTIMNVQI